MSWILVVVVVASVVALRGLLDKRLKEADPEPKITLTATRKKDVVSIKGTVEGLKKAEKTLRLRLALVEDEVSYAGRNQVRLHCHVVRAMPGGRTVWS